MASDVCASATSQLTIDLGAVRANYRALAERAAPAVCGAVIKADAYGLGARRVAAALYREGCRSFFVAQLCEALKLAGTAGAECTIYVLNGLDPGCEEQCATHRFIPVLNSASQVDRWRSLARAKGTPLAAALQVDSGMSRLGLSPQATAALAKDKAFKREVNLHLLLTHLACADEPERTINATQLQRFEMMRALFPGTPASIANSSGLFLDARYHLDVVRPGLALFGATPNAVAGTLRPAVQLHARVLQIRQIAAGEGVGYGHDYIADASRRLATIGVGYADGWPRSIANACAVWFDGHRLPLVGRVSMDSFTVDVSALPTSVLIEGDFVELLGPSQSIADAARYAGTIAYEMLTSLGQRHQRVYREGATTEIEPLGREL